MEKPVLVEQAQQLAKEDRLEEALHLISQSKEQRIPTAREIFSFFMEQGDLKRAIPFAAIAIEEVEGRYKLSTSIVQKLLKGSSPRDITQAILKATQLIVQAPSCTPETIKALEHLYEEYLKLPQLLSILLIYNGLERDVHATPATQSHIQFAKDTVERAKTLLKQEHLAMAKQPSRSTAGIAEEHFSQRDILKKCFLLDQNFDFDPDRIL